MPKTKRKPKPRKGNQAKKKANAPPKLSLKEQLAIKRERDRKIKEFTSFTLAVFAFALVAGGLLAIVGGIKGAVGGIAGILAISLSFKYPRQALWAFLIYMPLSGTVTYALGNSPILQLAKDGLYLPALYGVVQFCQATKRPLMVAKPLMLPLMLLLSICIVNVLFVQGYQQFVEKVSGLPIGMGILGLKVFIGYVPLLVCAYYMLRDRNDLLFLMRLSVVLIILCCGLGFIQYVMLLTGICEGTRNATGSDLFKADIDARCFVGGSLLYSPSQGQIRLPGTFVAPWQWGWFLISSAFLAFSSAFNDPKPVWRLIGLGSLGAVFVMAVVSGQRIALALVPTVVALLLVLTGQVANLKRFVPIAAILGTVLGITAIQNPAIMQERIDSLFGRWDAAPPHQFIVDQFTWSLDQAAFLGKGLGRATNSARVLGETVLVETYYPKVIYEVGPFGAIAFLIFVTVLTYVSFKAYRSCRDRLLRSYGAPLWLFILFISYNTYYYPLDVDPVAVYYWFFAGVILKLPEIERKERRSANEPEQSPQKRRRKTKAYGFG